MRLLTMAACAALSVAPSPVPVAGLPAAVARDPRAAALLDGRVGPFVGFAAFVVGSFAAFAVASFAAFAVGSFAAFVVGSFVVFVVVPFVVLAAAVAAPPRVAVVLAAGAFEATAVLPDAFETSARGFDGALV
jgi:hypothetical protein